MTIIQTQLYRSVEPVLQRTRRRGGLPPVVEFVLVLVMALCAVELFLRVAGVPDDAVNETNPVIGWSHIPNQSFTQRREGYSRGRTNSYGMRDMERTLTKPPGTFRIAVMGDSLTEAMQVPTEETYCSVLEKRLNARSTKRKFQVLNFGVGAYTLGQQYLALESFAMRFAPDLVIFAEKPSVLWSQLHPSEVLGPPPEFRLEPSVN